MSDIPRARKILKTLLRWEELPRFARLTIELVLTLLDREKPDFKVMNDCDPVTREQAEDIRRLRALHMSLREIAAVTKQNSGRVSEVVNGKRFGI